MGYTPIPLWVARMWSLEQSFGTVVGRRDPAASIRCSFDGGDFGAQIVPHRKGTQYRLFMEEALRSAIASRFLMSYMRDLDTRLSKSGAAQGLRHGTPPPSPSFWEFADLEFDCPRRSLRIVAHYVQKPDFPSLYARLAGSAPMRQIDDEIGGKTKLRVHKQPWRPRSRFETELGARNVVYMLADCGRALLYVGEADDMIARFRRGHPQIPEWTHYRYDLLPPEFAPHRVTIERQLICDMDAVLGAWGHELPADPAGFRLCNAKIDR